MRIAVHVDRTTQIRTTWLVQRRGTLSAPALAEVHRHLATPFLRDLLLRQGTQVPVELTCPSADPLP